MSQLKNYIEKELDRGFSKEVIKEKLLKSGYKKEVVKETFDVIEGKKEIVVRKEELPHVEKAKKSHWVFAIFAILIIASFSFWMINYLQKAPAISMDEEETEEGPYLIEQKRSDCGWKDDLCIFYWAIDTGDITHCERANNFPECEAKVVIELNNVDLCTLTSCITDFAIAKNQPEICEKVEDSSKDTCYSYYAIATNDKSQCPEGYFDCEFLLGTEEEKLVAMQEYYSTLNQEDMDDSLSYLASKHNDPTFCEFLSSGTECPV